MYNEWWDSALCCIRVKPGWVNNSCAWGMERRPGYMWNTAEGCLSRRGNWNIFSDNTWAREMMVTTAGLTVDAPTHVISDIILVASCIKFSSCIILKSLTFLSLLFAHFNCITLVEYFALPILENSLSFINSPRLFILLHRQPSSISAEFKW